MKKKIYKYPTGAEIPNGAVYMETIVQTVVQHANGNWDKCWLVWHYFLVEVNE